MHILVVGPHPGTQPPIPLIAERMATGLRSLECTVEQAFYGQHAPNETLRTKILDRARDAVGMSKLISSRKYDVVLLNTSHDWRALVRDLPLAITCKRSGVPFTFMYHGTQGEKLLAVAGRKEKLRRWLFALRLKMSAGAFVLAR